MAVRSAADGATYILQPKEEYCILSRRGRNLWRNHSETVAFSAAEGAIVMMTLNPHFASRIASA
eukprot:2453251-Pyramimonas_sp.AAC.1